MRIAIVSSTYKPGDNGQAIFSIRLAEGLAKFGHEVHVITASYRREDKTEMINGVHVHILPSIKLHIFKPPKPLNLFQSGLIRKLFREIKPEVVHIQDHYFVSHDAMLAARSLDLPMMGTNHFLPECVMQYVRFVPLPYAVKSWALWWIMLFTYNHLDLITTPTETAAGFLLATNVRVPVKAVSNGVDTVHFRPYPDFDKRAACRKYGISHDKVTFIYVGRLDEDKRPDLLIRGLARLREKGRQDIELIFVGLGTAEGKFRALVETLGVQDAVRFLGYIPNEQLPSVLQAADIFAMPSPDEGQSIATLEAMACGCPVLAANARALPELVEHQVNGYLFESLNDEAAAEGMEYLANHRADWKKMGQAGRTRAEAHGLEKTILNYSEIYSQLGEMHYSRANGQAGVAFRRSSKKAA